MWGKGTSFGSICCIETRHRSPPPPISYLVKKISVDIDLRVTLRNPINAIFFFFNKPALCFGNPISFKLPLATCFKCAAAAKSLQSCPTLCDPIDHSPPGSLVPGILQAKTLEWVAISFSNAWKWKVKVKSFSHVRLLASPWTAAYQAPPSMGFSRQEYWSGVPLPSPRKHKGHTI